MSKISQGKIEIWENEQIKTFIPNMRYYDDKPFDAIFNPSICGEYVSARAVVSDLDRIEKVEGKRPTRYRNYLLLGKYDPDTLETTGWKLIKTPEEFFWGIEDVRLFQRNDGLHGIGATFNHEHMKDSSWRIQQSEILIDYDKGKSNLIATYESPVDTNEKNWSPTVDPARHFDFAHSNTQVLIKEDGDVSLYGEPDGALQLHNGTQILKLDADHFLQLSHIPTVINKERVYANFAVMRNRFGITTGISQFFIWRKREHQSIEFVSGIAKTRRGILLSLGVQDDQCAFAYLPADKLKWRPYERGSQFYRWTYI